MDRQGRNLPRSKVETPFPFLNNAKNKKAREQLGKPKSLDDVLQREQLAAWFSAVCNLQNPVISAYLQDHFARLCACLGRIPRRRIIPGQS